MRNDKPRETWEDDQADHDIVGDVANWDNKSSYKDNVAAFSLQLAATETILTSMRETIKVLDASDFDRYEMENRTLDIAINVLKLKRFFTDLEIGAS